MTTYTIRADTGHNPWRIVRKTGSVTHKLKKRFPTRKAALAYRRYHRAVLDKCA